MANGIPIGGCTSAETATPEFEMSMTKHPWMVPSANVRVECGLAGSGAYIPDADRIMACLKGSGSRLSRPCLDVFFQQQAVEPQRRFQSRPGLFPRL
jgi:hypothetical protein